MIEKTDPTPPERKRGSGVRLAHEVLRDEILDLTLRPGSPVDEVTLAERFAMSRTPIREALVKLEGEGLVTTLPNRTTVVAQIDFPNLNAFFDALTLMYRVTTRLSAQFHSDADMARILACQAVYADSVADGDELAMIARNRDFHVAIAESGRNPYYTQLFARLLDEGRRILRLYYYPNFEPQAPHPFVLEHEAIIAAIAARDIALCDRLAKAHADQIVSQIQAMIARDQRQDIPL
ncbi:GntR family transcriptional regulator [Fuscibacter oryzae]|uniref:GntR family transcriptional regulator n=1 Tax=Fuscibacter oryzae TaxID=2803939 RepID=A0A8J7SU73_9RHOB|nr:GntR family transcriptional regulator [Fuscibacter oryzae]MBL4930006.1 GntR family transcriptional regulator [Fuscibacter oryzae]